jgi:hypothetical protein
MLYFQFNIGIVVIVVMVPLHIAKHSPIYRESRCVDSLRGECSAFVFAPFEVGFSVPSQRTLVANSSDLTTLHELLSRIRRISAAAVNSESSFGAVVWLSQWRLETLR